jgi:hypothetical protein
MKPHQTTLGKKFEEHFSTSVAICKESLWIPNSFENQSDIKLPMLEDDH